MINHYSKQTLQQANHVPSVEATRSQRSSRDFERKWDFSPVKQFLASPFRLEHYALIPDCEDLSACEYRFCAF
jgi:hypothetical protein